MTGFQLADSAKAPWTSTIVGVVDMGSCFPVGLPGRDERVGPAQLTCSALRRTWIGLLDRAVVAAVSAEGVEHHEVVDGAVVANGGGAHSGCGELAGVGLALVAQDVVLVDDDEGVGQPGEVVEARPQR